VSKGHGRLEQRTIRVSSDLAGYSTLPGLSQVAEVTTEVTQVATGQISTRTRYLVTSLTPALASPRRMLTLSRDHWGIENRLFHVTDDSFGEDRQVLQTHTAGATMSLLRATAMNLLRGTSTRWTTKMPLTARAEWVRGHPSTVLAALQGL
jgi:hypothetical protein